MEIIIRNFLPTVIWDSLLICQWHFQPTDIEACLRMLWCHKKLKSILLAHLYHRDFELLSFHTAWSCSALKDYNLVECLNIQNQADIDFFVIFVLAWWWCESFKIYDKPMICQVEQIISQCDRNDHLSVSGIHGQGRGLLVNPRWQGLLLLAATLPWLIYDRVISDDVTRPVCQRARLHLSAFPIDYHCLKSANIRLSLRLNCNRHWFDPDLIPQDLDLNVRFKRALINIRWIKSRSSSSREIQLILTYWHFNINESRRLYQIAVIDTELPIINQAVDLASHNLFDQKGGFVLDAEDFARAAEHLTC